MSSLAVGKEANPNKKLRWGVPKKRDVNGRSSLQGYEVDPPIIEKCQELSKQLFYNRLVRIAVLATPEIDDLLEKHDMQLLAMSHVYQIGWLKKKCEITIATKLTPDRVIDVLKVAKLCDAPRLYQQCMKLIIKEFAKVQRSDGWHFPKRYDPVLELEILEIMED